MPTPPARAFDIDCKLAYTLPTTTDFVFLIHALDGDDQAVESESLRLTQVRDPANRQGAADFKEWILEGRFQDAGGAWLLDKATNTQDGKVIRQLDVSDVAIKPVPAERFDPAK